MVNNYIFRKNTENYSYSLSIFFSSAQQFPIYAKKNVITKIYN
jgi:hypothetical protein